MPARRTRAPLKTKSLAKPNKAKGLDRLPEWNLADLYAAIDSPEVKRDLERADTECAAFEERYKGKLADLARDAGGARTLAAAVRHYEAIDDLIGRLMSFASLVYAGNTTDPARAKFYADVQERITAA